jgi:hypothetical protein
MEFNSEQQAQQLRRGSQVPSGPPGLARQPNLQGDISGDPSRVTSPSGQTQICKDLIFPQTEYDWANGQIQHAHPFRKVWLQP